MKTEVSFKSTAFNCLEPKEYFINECCFGDDLCKWLIGKLRARGIETSDEPGQEDFGWYFDFKVSGQFHTFVLGFQPNRPEAGDQWIGSVERAAGFLSSIFGGRRKNILPEAIECLNQVLISAPEIRDVQWHEFGKTT